MPIALLHGSLDELGDTSDVAKLKKDLDVGKNVIFYQSYRLGHLSLSGIAKDMSYFNRDAISIL